MNRIQLIKLYVAVYAVIPACAFSADQVIQTDGGFQSLVMSAVSALSVGAIIAAAKSWSDVNVLKKEVARLEKDIELTADKAVVQAQLDRIERRLDKMDERLVLSCPYPAPSK